MKTTAEVRYEFKASVSLGYSSMDAPSGITEIEGKVYADIFDKSLDDTLSKLIGNFKVIKADPNFEFYSTMDHDQNINDIANHIFEENQTSKLEDHFGSIYFVESFFIEKQWRGRDISLMVMQDFMEKRSENCSVFVLCPYPLDEHVAKNATELETKAISKKLIKHWKKLGFEKLFDGYYYFNNAYEMKKTNFNFQFEIEPITQIAPSV
jgi:hypothetical protein